MAETIEHAVRRLRDMGNTVAVVAMEQVRRGEVTTNDSRIVDDIAAMPCVRIQLLHTRTCVASGPTASWCASCYARTEKQQP